MTLAANTFNTDSFEFQEIPNASGNTINQGDLVYADSTLYQANSLVTVANSQYFAGVSMDTAPVPNNYSSQPNLPINVVRAGRVALKAKNGDSFNPYVPVWPTTIDAQTVSVTSGNPFPIGYVANLKDNSQRSFVGTGTNVILIDVRANTTTKV